MHWSHKWDRLVNNVGAQSDVDRFATSVLAEGLCGSAHWLQIALQVDVLKEVDSDDSRWPQPQHRVQNVLSAAHSLRTSCLQFTSMVCHGRGALFLRYLE